MTELDKKRLIDEEQKLLDEVIKEIENDLLDADERLKEILANYHKAKEMGADAYGMLVDKLQAKKEVQSNIQKIQQSKDELYRNRLIVEYTDEKGKKHREEWKVGLSTYAGKKGRHLVYSWLEKACRPFILDNYAEEADCVVEDKNGTYITHYVLKMKREIDAKFSHVYDVTHLYPLTVDEAKDIIFDAFLSELASRRDNAEFKNIIFSIQKKQGEIIKLPYDENIIVQGCAGSGKSMIMLHRLPIMIFDNPNVLNSSNIYIVSPSETYIQMVESMREELEIADLKMGTINQYYDHVLSKYGIDLEVYGKVSYATSVTREQEEYIYGNQLDTDIKKIAKRLIGVKSHDFSEGLTIFGLSERKSSASSLDAIITDYILMGNGVINANNAVLREYFNVCKTGLIAIKDLSDKVKNRRMHILRNIAKKISEQEELIKQKKKELEDTSLGEIAVKNRQDAIEKAREIILDCVDIREQVERDDEYFKGLSRWTTVIDQIQELFDFLKSQYEENSRDEIYRLMQSRKAIYKGYRGFISDLYDAEMKYGSYAENLLDYAKQYEKQLAEILTKNDVYLDKESLEEVIDATEYYSKLKESLPKEIYLQIMERFGQVPDEKGAIKALSFSPYLYLKIMYAIKGAPNAARERLICIDEAQGLAPEEMKLIRNLNGEKLIFNLFGDVKQHIEGTKGIDSWSEFNEAISGQEQFLMENYRNASQITEECNRRFGMEMEAINTPGSGVDVIRDEDEFYDKLHDLFVNVQKPGIRAIVVNDITEAKTLLSKYAVYQNKIHDMTGGHYDFHRTRWNLMTVEQAKGLEFGTVIAISGRMTPNKKYIAFTRALDELYIYDELFEISEEILVEPSKNTLQLDKPKRKEEKPKKEKKAPAIVDYSQSEVRKYFESKGVEVNDMRAKGGAFWIIGEQAKIKQFVDEACEKFGISGSYSLGKPTGFRAGWYSKTKK